MIVRSGRRAITHALFLAGLAGALLALLRASNGHPLAWAAAAAAIGLAARDVLQVDSPLRRNFPLLGVFYERLHSPRGALAAFHRAQVGPPPIDEETWSIV